MVGLKGDVGAREKLQIHVTTISLEGAEIASDEMNFENLCPSIGVGTC